MMLSNSDETKDLVHTIPRNYKPASIVLKEQRQKKMWNENEEREK